MSEHLPEPESELRDPGRYERDIGGDFTWVVVGLGLMLALIALIGRG